MIEAIKKMLSISEKKAQKLFSLMGREGTLARVPDKELEKFLDQKQIEKLRAAQRVCSFRVHLDGQVFAGTRQVFEHFHEILRDEKKELFFSVLLDIKNRIIRKDLISMGSLSLSVFHPREVFVSAIRESAGSILLVHNHPSGDPTPSSEDVEITYRLREVGKLVGIEVMDHLIIGNGKYVSFIEKHLI